MSIGRPLLYVIPHDEENRLSLLNVDRKTKEDLRLVFATIIDHDWQANTIANVAMENIIRALANNIVQTGSTQPINFFNLFTANVTVKKNEDAEKEGNINIAFIHGKIVEKLLDRFADSKAMEALRMEDKKLSRLELFLLDEKLFTEESGMMDMKISTQELKLLDKIESAARLELTEKYSIAIPEKYKSTLTILFVFVRNIFVHLIEKMVLNNTNSASINFNDNIEFHSILKNEEIALVMRPGMNAKLLIKSDKTTEADDDYDY